MIVGLIALGFIFTFAVVWELANYVVCGPWLTDDYLPILEKYLDRVDINSFDPSIISDLGGTFITNTPGNGIFAHYYWRGIGQIPRWTKMHQLIKAKHIELLTNPERNI